MKNNNDKIIMNQIIGTRNQRCIDWVWNNPNLKEGRNIPYEVKYHKNMFVPGGFLFAPTKLLKLYKFDEKLVGLQKCSDVKWSMSAINKNEKTFNYVFNKDAKCIIFTKKQFLYKKFRQICKCEICKTFT